MVFRGTNSSELLAVFGAALLIFGIWNLVTKKSRQQKKQAAYQDNLKKVAPESNEPISPPCTVNIIRASSFMGMAVNYELYLNGEPIGSLKNNSTITVQTSWKNNSLSSPTLFLKEFEAGPGATVNLKFRIAKNKSNFDIMP
jgi:hypothetical protein